ncbi:hypothetical protein [Alicyclobacillus sp. ALC3]|uniref:hypothetical protein n=1 Tax=Alicyclobacillus sp. ALC3 TaxID=2796143 RepID=UPI0023780C1E|nr:hypothetical protein [Alicyclobacillus sp. ALC3]WDL99764.1 hypothetical protein JC200_23615 [Alicyclobacillus sp. ALC3]
MEWKALVYHAVTDGLVQASDLTQLGSPDEVLFGHSDHLQIIGHAKADTDYGVGYYAGRPGLIDDTTDGDMALYYMPVGTVYEQKYGGFAWEVV